MADIARANIVGSIVAGAIKSETLSLRDWFAGMALQGITNNPDSGIFLSWSSDELSEYAKRIAKLSYLYADEMIKASKEKRGMECSCCDNDGESYDINDVWMCKRCQMDIIKLRAASKEKSDG